MTRPRAALPLVLLGLLASACSSSSSAGPRTPGATAPSAAGGALVVVSAPLSSSPWIGGFSEDGAKLAVEQANASLPAGKKIRLEVLDNAGSPQQAVANARQAVKEHAAELITDGTGALAVSQVTDAASLPVFVVFDGGASFIDGAKHPSMFRMAPANQFMTRRLADYLAGKTNGATKAAVLSEDTQYGRDGAGPLVADLGINKVPVVDQAVIPSSGANVTAQVLAARRKGATSLLVWAGAPDVAAVVQAARSSGWQVPIYTGPTGEDPLVRQQLAAHPDWVEGLTFVSFRITTEQGPAPFIAYRKVFEKRFGEDKVGVVADGKPVIQPPDWSCYSYDAVVLIEAALAKSGGQTGAPLLAAVEQVATTSANGDERGFTADSREGVSPADMYFGVFHDMRFAPVKDDLLSNGLPTVAQ